MVIIVLLVLALIVFLALRNKTGPFTAKSNWKHYFPDIQFSADGFYSRVADCIKETQLTKIDIGRESFSEKSIFSAKREYLRLKVNEYVFFVGAAPFGTGTFVSWWLCEINPTQINNIPVASKLLGLDRDNKTFYQCDTENMYKSAIHHIVTSVAEEYGNKHGNRAMTAIDMQYN